MEQILINNGFEFYAHCWCGGKYQRKFRQIINASNKVYIFPKNNQFKILIDNRTRCISQSYLLEEKLKEYELIK